MRLLIDSIGVVQREGDAFCVYVPSLMGLVMDWIMNSY